MPDLDLAGLDAFQELHAAWSAHNFPNTGSLSHRPLLGVGEEAGELAEAALTGFSLLNVFAALGRLDHAHLKGEQRIRHTPEQIIEKKLDAVGDVLVYLSDYCNREGLRLSDCLNLAWDEIKDRDWIAHPETGRPAVQAIVDDAVSFQGPNERTEDIDRVMTPVTLKDVLEGPKPAHIPDDFPPGPADGGAGQRWLEEKATAALGPRMSMPGGADLRDPDEPKYGEGEGPVIDNDPDFVVQGDDAEDNRG